MHTAFVLAAGLGTRLRPLTWHRPKALVPVCGVPMLAYSVALCRRHGLDAVVNAHHLADQVQAWAAREDLPVSVEAPDILGTGGGLAAVADRLAERFAVVNADVLCDVDLGALIAAVPDGGAAMALRVAPDAAANGPVATDATGTVVQVRAHVAEPVGEVDRTAHFTGIHAMHRDALAPVGPGFSDVITAAYAPLVPRRLVRAVRHPGTWLDIGDPAAYLAANLAILAGGVVLPLDPWAHGERRDGCWIGDGARVAGSATGSVIGAGAIVPADASVDGCVVWDGVTVPPGRHRGAIVHDGGVWQG